MGDDTARPANPLPLPTDPTKNLELPDEAIDDAPPPYSEYSVLYQPIGNARPDEHETTPLTTAPQDVKVSVFNISWRLKEKPQDHFVPMGTLYFGLKTVTNILDHCVWFKPFPDDESEAKRTDISHCITATAATIDGVDVTQYQKASDPNSPYSFLMNMQNDKTEDAKLVKSTFTMGGNVYDLKGSFQSHDSIKIDATIDSIKKPNNLHPSASADELDKIDPAAHTAVGDLGVGQDGAQYYGDRIMQKIMMHAIDDTEGKKYLPPTSTLTVDEQAVLNKYYDFFRRGAIHMVCEQIKKSSSDPKDPNANIAEHIKWKWDSYLKMCSSPSSGRKAKYGAAYTYGFDPEADAQLIDKLRLQFKDASMACYELGYKKMCPEWERYTICPDYWFKIFEQRILSPEHMDKWAVQSVDTTKTETFQRSGKDWVLVWSNKLSLLKHAAERQNIDMSKSSIENTSNTLLNRLHQQVAYSLLVNDELVKDIQTLSDTIDKSNIGASFKKKYGELVKEAQDAALAMSTAMPYFMTLLLNQNSDIVGKVREYWKARLPGGTPKNLTIGQIQEGIEMVDLKQIVPQAQDADAIHLLEGKGADIEKVNEEGGKLIKKLKLNKSGAWKSVFKGVLHGAALLYLGYFLHGEAANLSVSELGTAICATISEAMMIGNNIISWALGKVGFTGTVTKWFAGSIKLAKNAGAGKRALFALAGDMTRIVRIVGLVGCVFNLVTSYWGMTAGGDTKDAETARTFAKIQFGLGVVEGLAIVGGIVAEIAGFEVLAMICGPLALIVGAAALIVIVVQMIWFQPDPQADIKAFMGGLPTEYGSYDQNSTTSGPEYCDVPADEKGINSRQFDNLVTSKIRDPPSDEDLKKLPESHRRVTAGQHLAAMNVRLMIAEFEDLWEQATNPAPFLALLQALNHSLRFFVTGNFYYAARGVYQGGYNTFRAGWPPQPWPLVQIPNNLRQIFTNVNTALLQAIQNFHATLDQLA